MVGVNVCSLHGSFWTAANSLEKTKITTCHFTEASQRPHVYVETSTSTSDARLAFEQQH